MKFISFTVASAVVFISAISVARAGDPVLVAPNLSLHDAAVALAHDYDELYGRKDVTGMASLYAPDGELVSPGGKIIHGRTELEAYYRALFASGATGHKIDILESHGLGDAGYSVADFSVSVRGATILRSSIASTGTSPRSTRTTQRVGILHWCNRAPLPRKRPDNAQPTTHLNEETPSA